MYYSMTNLPSRLAHAAVRGTEPDYGPAGVPYAEDGNDFTHVQDCAELVRIVHLAETLPHRTYNAGNGSEATVQALVDAVRSAVPDVRLACAGDGDRIGVARYAENLGIAEAVKFTGWVGPSGKRALLEHAAVFALPSYEEALPVSLLEAMSAGVPVVATPVGGIVEVVVDRASGLLVAPGDTAGLERALTRLLVEPALAARLGAAARETARLRFAPERSLAILEELYESLGVDGVARTPRMPESLRKAA